MRNQEGSFPSGKWLAMWEALAVLIAAGGLLLQTGASGWIAIEFREEIDGYRITSHPLSLGRADNGMRRFGVGG